MHIYVCSKYFDWEKALKAVKDEKTVFLQFVDCYSKNGSSVTIYLKNNKKEIMLGKTAFYPNEVNSFVLSLQDLKDSGPYSIAIESEDKKGEVKCKDIVLWITE